MGQKYTINSDHTLKCYVEFITNLCKAHKFVEITYTTEKKRTDQQNKSLHVFCNLVAEALNESGHTFTVTINGKSSEIDWSMTSVKEYIWRVIQKAITGKDSSTKPTTKEYIEIQENMIRLLAERFYISREWPTREQQR
jgi:hypothetical protein